jgi:hypothetical protein
MYDFIFYFFYGMLRKTDKDPVFTAKLGVFIGVWLHVMALLSIIEYLVGFKTPTFSEHYAINKAYWYIPGIVVLILLLLCFNNKKTDAIMKKYSSRGKFYSFPNVLFFLLSFGIPILIMAIF